MTANDKQGQISVNEAGKKGGDETSGSHDKEFYQEIGTRVAKTAAAISRMIPSAPPKPVARADRKVAATLPTTVRKPRKLAVKATKTAMVADATVNVLDAGEPCSTALMNGGHHAFTRH